MSPRTGVLGVVAASPGAENTHADVVSFKLELIGMTPFVRINVVGMVATVLRM